MSSEIVRNLMKKHKSNVKLLKESLPVKGIKEAEEDEFEEEDIAPEEDFDIDSDESPEDNPEEDFEEPGEYSEEEVAPANVPSSTSHSSGPSYVDSEDSYDDPDSLAEAPPLEKEHANPLENSYAVNYKLGQEVALKYSNGTKSKLKGIIDGYDKEGFYRIKWGNGMTTSGITDIALADLLDTKLAESKCVCGSTRFVNESNSLVCDRCGRIIRESVDPLTLADKKRPKGKRLIRSEAHPMSTSVGESIRKAFKGKKSIREEKSDIFEYLPELESLEGQFWTRRDELKEDIEDLGYEVVELNAEYVIVTAPEDEEVEIQIPLEGTSRTMTLDFDKGRVL